MLLQLGRLNVAIAATWGLRWGRGFIISWWVQIGALVIAWSGTGRR